MSTLNNDVNKENELQQLMLCKQKNLPSGCGNLLIACMVDPYNDKNHFIFGSFQKSKCWKYDHTQEKYISLKDDSNSATNLCAHFTVNKSHYAFILGKSKNESNVGESDGYQIYEFPENDQCNDNDIQHFSDKITNQITFLSMFTSAMITDVFEKNKIHVINSMQYGYFEFTAEKGDILSIFFFVSNFK